MCVARRSRKKRSADDHGAAGEVLDRVFERGKGLDVEVVGRLVQQQDIAP
jgi:hypothetical protein